MPSATGTMHAMIQLENVEFHYDRGDFCIRVPHFEVGRGEVAAVIGPSGSGKTTLLYLVAGIVVPQAGRVTVDGREVSAWADAERRAFRIARMGLVFQEFALLDYLSVLDNALLPYRITPALRLDRSVTERARTLAANVGIGDKLGRPVRRLSHGEKQRVAICRALVPDPSILLADEPTGNLDPTTKERVIDLLLAHAREHDTTVLTVTHDHGLLDRFDRVVDVADFHVGRTTESAS